MAVIVTGPSATVIRRTRVARQLEVGREVAGLGATEEGHSVVGAVLLVRWRDSPARFR
jgi:hypothetical protein